MTIITTSEQVWSKIKLVLFDRVVSSGLLKDQNSKRTKKDFHFYNFLCRTLRRPWGFWKCPASPYSHWLLCLPPAPMVPWGCTNGEREKNMRLKRRKRGNLPFWRSCLRRRFQRDIHSFPRSMDGLKMGCRGNSETAHSKSSINTSG